jgi:protein-disulfide isomerase
MLKMKQVIPISILLLLSVVTGFAMGRSGSAEINWKVDQIDRNLRVLAEAVGVDLGPSDTVGIDNSDSPFLGPVEAPITIVEFSDFECGYCRKVYPTLLRIRNEYDSEVKIVFKHFPLSFHKNALLAHRAAISAGEQGKFWEMHDLIFENFKDLSRETMLEHASRLNLNSPQFEEILDSQTSKDLIDRDIILGRDNGVTGTPVFFVNGRKLVGAQPFSVFKEEIERALRDSA